MGGNKLDNFILKLCPHAIGGFADCAIGTPVLAFDPCNRDWITAIVQHGGRHPTCQRVGNVH